MIFLINKHEGDHDARASFARDLVDIWGYEYATRKEYDEWVALLHVVYAEAVQS